MTDRIVTDHHRSEPRLCFGPKRFVLRLQGSRRWIAADIRRDDQARIFTESEAEALQFSTRGEALTFWRHVSPPLDDDDGHINRPLAHLDLEIEEVTPGGKGDEAT